MFYKSKMLNIFFKTDLIPKYPVLKRLIPMVNDYTSNCNFYLKFYNTLSVLRKPLALNR